MKKKNDTFLRRLRKDFKMNQKLMIGVGVFVIAFFAVLSIMYVVLGNYSGLGNEQTMKENTYSNSGFYRDNGFRYYEDDEYETLPGIDVSTFQHEVDWDAVADSGVKFVMIRVGYRGLKSGEINIDERFKENIKGAKRAGLKVGVYFFSSAITPDEAIEEARFVINHIRGKGVTYPVAFDMEITSADDRNAGLTAMEKTEIADAFLKVIKRNGFDPMIYGSKTWLTKDVDMNYLSDYSVWMAHYTKRPTYEYEYQMWQYSSAGSIDGIKGNVDMNMFFIKK